MKLEMTAVQKLAKVLKSLVIIAFVCNIVVLYLVPVAVMSDGEGLLAGCQSYIDGLLFPREGDVVGAGIIASFFAWFGVWVQGEYAGVLAGFLVLCGCCTAIILWQARRVLDTILNGETFSLKNAANMKRAGICCLIISVAAFVRLIWGFFYYKSIAPLLTYNALFVPVFAMGFLLCMVMSALFRQAAELKEENDLTI